MRSLLKKIIPARWWAWIREYRSDRQTSASPDRAVLVKELIPELALTGEVLWVGCRRYTKDYYDLIEKQGARCWTLEIDPSAARWGRKGRHIVGNLLEVETLFPGRRFDTVLCNGIFGWGINTEPEQREASRAMAAILKPGGKVLLGWDIKRIPDPLPLLIEEGFSPCRERQVIAGYYQHVYDVLCR